MGGGAGPPEKKRDKIRHGENERENQGLGGYEVLGGRRQMPFIGYKWRGEINTLNLFRGPWV